MNMSITVIERMCKIEQNYFKLLYQFKKAKRNGLIIIYYFVKIKLK